jgi:phosphoribosylformylglycinamidine (FGAM) synthase-like enzyme
MTMDFKDAGDVLFLIGKSSDDIGSSEYLHKIHGVEFSPVPHFDLEEEYALQQKVAELIKNKVIESAHDVSEGGLFVTLLESCFNRNLGIDVVAADTTVRKDAYWFGESQSRVVVSVKEEKVPLFKKIIGGFAHEELGEVTGGGVEIDGEDWDNILVWKEKYDNAIGNLLAGHDSEHALAAL